MNLGSVLLSHKLKKEIMGVILYVLGNYNRTHNCNGARTIPLSNHFKASIILLAIFYNVTKSEQ